MNKAGSFWDAEYSGGRWSDAEQAPPDSASSSPTASGARDAAVADLARRLRLDPTVVTVVSVEQVTWRDASAGCPEPGMMYAQVLTDGARIILEAAGTRYVYHSTATRRPFLCENPQPH